MKISVAIPAYNCAATIRETLDSVLRQTVQADEILVLNDGSTDETLAILETYSPHITIISQDNRGLGAARDVLCRHAQGDLIAFLDSDDIWHPRYLEIQCRLVEEIPNGIAYFTAHENFTGSGGYEWASDPVYEPANVELMQPAQFLERYCKNAGSFVCSNLCMPKQILAGLGDEPFKLREGEDVHMFLGMAQFGQVVFLPKPFVAYRVREGSMSSDLLRMAQGAVQAFEMTVDRYSNLADGKLMRAYKRSFSSKRRFYAKILLGLDRTGNARDQLRRSLGNSGPLSLAKSLRLLALSYFPKALQPAWPSAHREWEKT